jgi:hypothetical protein
MVCQASVYTGIRDDGLSWTNWSCRVTRTRESYFVPAPSPNAAVPGVLVAPLGLMQLVNVIAAATAASKHVHAVGTGWAYEDLAVGDNWTISLERLASRLLTTVGATTDRHGAAGSGPGLTDEWFHRQLDPLAPTRLVHVEAGITIGALVDLMQADALALPTLSGANGQQHMRDPAAAAPRPARAQPPSDPAQTPGSPAPGRVPTRPAGPAAPGPRRPAAADEVSAPAQDRVGGDQQPHPVAARFGYYAEQGRDQGPVRPVQVRATRLPPPQDRELAAQDQDLGGLPRLLTPGQPQPRG